MVTRPAEVISWKQLNFCTPKQADFMLKVRRPNISANVHGPEDMGSRSVSLAHARESLLRGVLASLRLSWSASGRKSSYAQCTDGYT